MMFCGDLRQQLGRFTHRERAGRQVVGCRGILIATMRFRAHGLLHEARPATRSTPNLRPNPSEVFVFQLISMSRGVMTILLQSTASTLTHNR
jgi:hypothetical protein